jgi:hypothetical protein
MKKKKEKSLPSNILLMRKWLWRKHLKSARPSSPNTHSPACTYITVLGEVKVGEICLFVFTSSKHRKAAIDACEELVERIKKEVPVWGKEILENEKAVWKENT